MPDVIPDLWPDDVAAPSILTPLAILKFQAGQLRQRTKGLLEADIQTQEKVNGGLHLQHSFDLIAPALNRYRYRLFTVEHDGEMVYPVTVYAEGVGFPADEIIFEQHASAATQDQFLGFIAQILKADQVRSVIQSLIARSNEARGNAPTS